MKNFGQTALVGVTVFGVTALGALGVAFALSPDAQAQAGHVLAQLSDDRHVCEVTEKHVEHYAVLGDYHYVHLNCGVDGVDDHEIVTDSFTDTDADAKVYARATVGEVYVVNIHHRKGHGEVVSAINPTDLPIGHHFQD